jgi:hypothetical protein
MLTSARSKSRSASGDAYTRDAGKRERTLLSAWLMPNGAIDDGPLRTAAQQLLRTAREEIPIVNFAALACDEARGKLLIEVAFDGAAVSTTVLFDRGGAEQHVLLQIENTKAGTPKDARPLYPRLISGGR